MKVAKTNVEEILSLHRVLNEVEMLHKELKRYDFCAVDWDDYEVLKDFGVNEESGERDPEVFIEDLVRHLSGIHFQRILFNCEVLLSNCADPDQDVLDWNQDIKKGLELLGAWTNEEPGRRREFPVKRLKHAELERVGDSGHASQCPCCTPGTLAMRRDLETVKLLAEDACLFCGQRVVYTDVVDGVIVEQAEV